MRVERRGCIIDPFGIDFGCDEAGSIAEGARVELRRELADEAVAFQALDALDDFFFGHVDRLSDEGERR